MKTRVNGQRVPFNTVEIRVGGASCKPQPVGYFENTAEAHDPELQLQDYERLADLAQKRARRQALRKKNGWVGEVLAELAEVLGERKEG